MSKITTSPRRPACVVQIGFAGSRQLLAPGTEIEPDRYCQEIQDKLTVVLQELPQKLALDKFHFLCGVSQIAIGADTLFTRACKELRIRQRIFLPQGRHEYLVAVGSEGAPDFNHSERLAVEDLLRSEHIIEVRVVSISGDRRSRFEDTNLAILEASDVIVCMLCAEPEGKRGGTVDLLELGKRSGKPTLEVRVELRNGHEDLDVSRHNFDSFPRPELPSELDPSAAPSPGLPSLDDYCASLKKAASQQANWLRKVFVAAALIIIATHIAATALATIALVGHGPPDAAHHSPLIPALLGLELISLVCGFGVHQILHRSRAVQKWAIARVIAEINRSIQALGDLPVNLDYLFTLPLPDKLQPLLRTLHFLKLGSTHRQSYSIGEEQRRVYVNTRLLDVKDGQLTYYSRKAKRARFWQACAYWTFFGCSLVAIVATATKLLTLVNLISVSLDLGLLGMIAIIFPVLAVGALSLSAANDLEARIHTYDDILRFLGRQTQLLESAVSAPEFAKLVAQTEARLLSETATWYSRRSFTGVA